MSEISPLVSVVIPVFNCESYLNKSIDSIINQTYRNLEILIADDSSSDKSYSILYQYSKKDPRITLFKNSENLGYLKTCNFLFSQATGEFITFQDADDYSEFNRIELQVQFMLRNPKIGLCSTNYQRFDNWGKLLESSQYPSEDDQIRNSISKELPFPFFPGSLLLRRVVYDAIGGYREFFNRIGSEDYDWILLASEKFKMGNLKEVLYYYRFNPDSISQKDISLEKMLSKEMAWLFAMQRRESGKDSLMEDDPNALQKEWEKVKAPFYQDQSLVYRKNAYAAINHKKWKRAFIFILKALQKAPLKKENIQCLNLWLALLFNDFLSKVKEK
jgi:glycosyltransferase involved in cell wall biosynthesis